jgi:hypothetical protein
VPFLGGGIAQCPKKSLDVRTNIIMRNLLCLTLLLCTVPILFGQGTPSYTSSSPVPTIVKLSGAVRDLEGKNLSGLHNLNFALYKDESGGTSIWSEMQNVMIDAQGRYTAFLGSASTGGIPAEIFASGETRWVGVTPEDGVERSRFAIATVPYAFKAAEADTLGGRKPEEFVSVPQLTSMLRSQAGQTPSPVGPVWNLGVGAGISNAMVPGLNADFLRGFPDTAFAKLNAGNVFSESQSMTGGVRLPATVSEQNQSNFLDSAPVDFESSIAEGQGWTYQKQVFRWRSQPTAGASGSATARLGLLFGADVAAPMPTGLSFNSDGTINFAPGQQFPPNAVMEAISQGETGPSGGTTAGSEPPVVNTVSYRWNEIPAGGGIKAGLASVTLAPCPPGVNGTDAWHYLYVSKTGTPEVVLITGGTCIARAKSGTIDFTTKYDHPAGYSVSSATDGVQEATIGASISQSGGQISRNVTIDPGAHLFRARLSIRATGITIVGSGATITCAMSDTCIMLGDPANSNQFQDITLSGIRVAAGIPEGTWSAVEDNANGSTISNFSTATSSIPNASFGSLVQVDNDQAAHIDTLNTSLGVWSRCDTSFCSTAIIGPGHVGDSGVIWVSNSNLALNCTANGIDNQDGNTLHVTTTIVEAYPEFGVRSTSTYGDVPNVQFNGVYEEIGNCINPLGTGMAGLIAETGFVDVYSSGLAGQLPVFANTGNTLYNYSVVVHSSVMGTSPAYLAGYAKTNGTGAVPVVWDQIGETGIVTYDLLRTTGVGVPAPFGTGLFAVANGIPATICSNHVCSFVDDAASQPSSYTVATQTNYWVSQKLWPGLAILTYAYDYQNTGGGEPTAYYTDVLNGSQAAGIVNSAGGFAPSVFAQVCEPQGAMSSVWEQCLGGDAVSNDNPVVTATVLQLSNNGGSPGGLKGREIFEMPVGSSTAATHVITLADSNPAKTMATANNRPPWDSNDTYIGYDQPDTDVSHTQLSFGAPASISEYIGNVGDNLNWVERVTKSAKTFQVPVQANSGMTVNGNLIANGPCLGSGCGPLSPSGTQITDTFTEPNSGTLGPNWTTVDGTCAVVGNQAQLSIGSDTRAFCAYTQGSFSNDQSATAQLTVTNPGAFGLGLRMSSTAETGYFFFCVAASSSVIAKFVAGVGYGITVGGPACALNDVLRFQVSGTNLTATDVTQGWSIVGTDQSIASGYPGLVLENISGVAFDNFQGGNLQYFSNSVLSAAGWQATPRTVSELSCGPGNEGTTAAFTDSSTGVLGAAISGDGLNHVLAYCDGVGWIVAASRNSSASAQSQTNSNGVSIVPVPALTGGFH